jgi:glutaredoxin 3
MSALIYTKPACPFCDYAKMLMVTKNVSYTESVISKDIVREEFVEMFPDVKTVPLIFIDGVRIGGYNDLKEYFENEAGKSFLTEEN